MQLSVTSPSLLKGSLADTQSVLMKISDDLLLSNSSKILLNRGLWAMHSGFESSVKALHHVRGSGKLRIPKNSVKMIPEL